MSPEYAASTTCSTPSQITALPGVRPLAVTAASSKAIWRSGLPEFPWAKARPASSRGRSDSNNRRLIRSSSRNQLGNYAYVRGKEEKRPGESQRRQLPRDPPGDDLSSDRPVQQGEGAL